MAPAKAARGSLEADQPLRPDRGELHLSERHACRLAGLSRDSYRHPPQGDAAKCDLAGRIVEIAHARQRFGHRPIYVLLHPQFPGRQPQARAAPVRGREPGRAQAQEVAPSAGPSACRCGWPAPSTRYEAWTSSATAWPTDGA